jgi:HAD superfamily hydrolase (TIGR01509 family)
MSAIGLVIFDCDGVLVDSELLSTQAIQDVLLADGVEVTAEMVAGCIGMKQTDILARLSAATGRTISASVSAAIWPMTKSLFQQRLSCTTGIKELLAVLPYRCCVASSSSHERIAFSLALTGLDVYFERDRIFSSSDVTRGKPAPDLFLHAAERMGTRPEQCVVIEDSRFGVMGAVAAGMTAIGFTGGSHSGPEMAAALSRHGATWTESSWAGVAAHLDLDPQRAGA